MPRVNLRVIGGVVTAILLLLGSIRTALGGEESAALAAAGAAQAQAAAALRGIGPMSSAETGGTPLQECQMQVTYLEGTATAGGAALQAGDMSQLNQQIQTGPSGKLELKLKDGSYIRLGPNTKLNVGCDLPTISVPLKRRFELLMGRIWGSITSGSGGDYSIKGVNAAPGVRGTFFYFDSTSDEDRLFVLPDHESEVEFAPIGGTQSITVSQCQAARVRAGTSGPPERIPRFVLPPDMTTEGIDGPDFVELCNDLDAITGGVTVTPPSSAPPSSSSVTPPSSSATPSSSSVGSSKGGCGMPGGVPSLALLATLWSIRRRYRS